MAHVPVLLQEVMTLLAPQPGETVVDGTVGDGGHAVRLAEAVGPTGHVIGFDLDAETLEAASPRIEAIGPRWHPIHENFARMAAQVHALGLAADVILVDLGFSSRQMDDPDRGMSFQADGPLDMRLDRSSSNPTAARILATLPEDEIARMIREYGEEPLAGKIARKVVQTRVAEPIETTASLARLVLGAYGGRARTSRVHPATRTFMALRIAVNSELEALRMLLESIENTANQRRANQPTWIQPGARIGIISFHSLEDRLVKRSMRALGQASAGTVLTRKPVTATAEEMASNPRSRSAKLRVIKIEGRQEGEPVSQ